jgi:hypothetical protein
VDLQHVSALVEKRLLTGVSLSLLRREAKI